MIVNHGLWERYTPDKPTETVFGPIMHCRHEKSKRDWYEYQGEFKPNTIKATVFDGFIRAASRDVTKLFPQNCYVIEIDDSDTSSDPQSVYGNRVYDVVKNEIV